MADIFVISDTHFGHKNILNFMDDEGQPVRSFTSIDDMNETMIERWNSVVKQGDKVYHLGDVYFGNEKSAGEILSRLNGKKRLIVGNHDRIKSPVLHRYFESIYMWRQGVHDLPILMTHVPVHPSTLREHRFSGKQMVNLHGHIHQNKSPDGPYKCVCVEQTDYYPMAIEDLLT